MNLKIWMINLILILLVFFFGLKTYTVWSDGQIPETDATGAGAETRGGPAESPPPESAPPPSDFYDGIAEKNLFSPDRKEPVSESAEEKADLPGEDISVSGIVLTGTLVADGYKAALVSGGSTPKGKWLREGERLNGFEVSSIQKDRILLKEGDRQVQVLLYGGKKRKKERRTAAIEQQPVVVNAAVQSEGEKTSGGGEGGEKQKDGAADGGQKSKEGKKGAASSAKTDDGLNGVKKPPVSVDQKEGEEIEYEIIQTPFGKIKRRK